MFCSGILWVASVCWLSIGLSAFLLSGRAMKRGRQANTQDSNYILRRDTVQIFIMRRGKSALSKRHSPRNGVEKRGYIPFIYASHFHWRTKQFTLLLAFFFSTVRGTNYGFFLSLFFWWMSIKRLIHQLLCLINWCVNTVPCFVTQNQFTRNGISFDFAEIMCEGQKGNSNFYFIDDLIA